MPVHLIAWRSDASSRPRRAWVDRRLRLGPPSAALPKPLHSEIPLPEEGEYVSELRLWAAPGLPNGLRTPAEVHCCWWITATRGGVLNCSRTGTLLCYSGIHAHGDLSCGWTERHHGSWTSLAGG